MTLPLIDTVTDISLRFDPATGRVRWLCACGEGLGIKRMGSKTFQTGAIWIVSTPTILIGLRIIMRDHAATHDRRVPNAA